MWYDKRNNDSSGGLRMDRNKLKRIQEILQVMTDRQYVSGVSCMVVKDGEEQCYYEAGYRDTAAELKMTPTIG